MSTTDVPAATIEQVRMGKDGRVHVFSAAESQIAKDLEQLAQEANTTFLLRWHDATLHYSVVQKYGPADDDEQLVATCVDPDFLPMVVTEVRRMVRSRSYDLAAELDAHAAAAQKDRERETDERAGEWAQRNWSRMRRDMGANQDRIVVPASIPRGEPS